MRNLSTPFHQSQQKLIKQKYDIIFSIEGVVCTRVILTYLNVRKNHLKG